MDEKLEKLLKAVRNLDMTLDRLFYFAWIVGWLYTLGRVGLENAWGGPTNVNWVGFIASFFFWPYLLGLKG